MSGSSYLIVAISYHIAHLIVGIYMLFQQRCGSRLQDSWLTIRYCMIYIYICVCVYMCVCMYIKFADIQTKNGCWFWYIQPLHNWCFSSGTPRPQTWPGNPPKLAQEWSASLGVAKLLEYPKKGRCSHRCGHKNTAYGSTKSGFCPGNKLQTVQISGSSQCSCPCDSSVGLPLSSHWRALNPLQYLQKPRFSNV